MSRPPSRTAPRVSEPSSAATPAQPRAKTLSPATAALLPLGFAAALVAMALLTPIRRHPTMFPTFLGSAATLLAWSTVLYVRARHAGRALTLEVALYKHHWVQACAQIGVFLYWGWHVRFVYGFFPLILAQLLFAYGVDSLLTWSRRDSYKLGFGPFPVILSINLFLWFRPEWFHWQFVMILMGYLAKELIRWQRDGRSRHIFNPSSFPLAVFSLALIATGTTDITLGAEIAQTQFNPPYMYFVIFLVSIPGQILFGVARMTMPAVITMFGISHGYFMATGVYLFPDAYISLPVFLGMHLLFTDPSTSPRTETGQIAFGVLYALGTLAFYLILQAIGAPPFYDKLLPVPLMNLTVRRIDRIVESDALRRLNLSRIGSALTPQRRNLAYVSIWTCVFLGFSATRGLGDDHPGQYLPFWQQACEDGSERACEYATFMKFNYCTKGSGWACNEWAIYAARSGSGRRAADAFRQGCDLGFSPACRNASLLAAAADAASFIRDRPRLEDLPIILRGSKGPVRERDPTKLYARACEQGWPGTCEGPFDEPMQP